MRISDWSSDVCSSDLHHYEDSPPTQGVSNLDCSYSICFWQAAQERPTTPSAAPNRWQIKLRNLVHLTTKLSRVERSEEHTSELQSLMRISYAVLCLKKKTTQMTA